MRHSKRTVTLLMLFGGVLVPVCGAGTDDILSGRDLLRVMRGETANAADSNSDVPEKQTQPKEPASGGRVVHFHKDRSLGELFVLDSDFVRHVETFNHWADRAKWQYFAQAKGDVTVPAGKRLRLQITLPRACRDLSPLSSLRPDDLYRLNIYGSFTTGGPKPDDRCMRHVAALTGLKVLDLSSTNITGRGIKAIERLESLERLTLPDRINDAGMVQVARLKSLKGLYFKKNKVTDSGLRHLTKLTSLEELELGGERIGDKGLIHLAKLPHLRYLMLGGKNFTDDGMIHLQNVPTLKILHLGHIHDITDTGLEHLSRIPTLEAISFHWNENITNEGIVHLKKLPALRKLDIKSSKVTDEGLAHLKEIKTLEYLGLPPGVIYRRDGPVFTITDQGLAHLAQLENLKYLEVGCLGSGSAITNAGLRHISRLGCMEELSISGRGITSEGMAHVSNLTRLSSLMLFGCPKLGDDALTELAKTKGLSKLYLAYTNMTVSGLARLNSLAKLTNLDVKGIERGESALDISGLANLEKLSITLKNKAVFEDDDLACLGELRQLRWLQISPRAFSDAGIAHLAGLTNMERVGIGGPEMTDKALSYLSNMQKLNHLTIDDADLTDTGLRYLEGLKCLTHLEITSENAFSNAALQRLRKKLLNCQTFEVMP